MSAWFVVGWLACGQDGQDEHAEHATGGEHAGHTPPANGAAAGVGVVEVDAAVAEALALRTEPVTVSSSAVERRSPATVGWDPHAVTRITVQAGGQVRELGLPLPGEAVRKGDLVARLFQPEVRAAFEELRVAATLGEPWLQAARSRLLATGIGKAEIDRALASGITPETFSVRAPTDGIVLEHPVREGAWVAPGGIVGVLGDPGALVVEMVVTGAAPALGSTVTLRNPALGQTWTATVSSLLPTAEVAGAQVRLVPQGQPPVGRPLVAEWTEEGVGGIWVASTAVVDTGERRVVFVEVGPGKYAPREVVLGARADERIQILAGLSEGERVVVSGTFLLDSETQIGTMGHAAHGG
jgi:Cu(I)/Ag(I) efflux system membrane fusion protein